MLIRSEQKAEFGRARMDTFVREMMVHLASNFTEARTMGDAGLKAWVEAGIAHGQEFALEKRYDLRRFLEHRMEHGEGFPSKPWAAPVIDDDALSASEKMDRIDAITLYEVRGDE